MHTEIYSNMFDQLCIFNGEPPAGKALDIDATDSNLQRAIDSADSDWLAANPEPDIQTNEYEDWMEEQRNAHDRTCCALVESISWYDDAYVWVKS